MGLREINPYIDQDLTNICNAYVKGANQQDTEASVFAIFTPEVIEAKNFSRNVISNLETYRSRDSSVPSFNFAGLEIQNSVNTILEADSVGDALKTAAADCVPCEDRILALLNLNPLEDFLDLLNRDISRRFQTLFSLIDLLNNIDIFNDICLLLRQLNFQCVPDLQRIALLLTLLLSKYKDKLSLSIDLPEALIGNLMAPFLQSLGTLLDQYVQMIIDPIECIIDELNRQLQKLDIAEGIATGEAIAGINREDPRNPEGSIPDIRDPLKGATTVPLGNALADLVDYLKQGKTYIDSQLNFVREQLEALLNSANINTNIKIVDAKNKINLLRLISLVTSIIQATKSGGLDCGDLESIDASKKLETFLNNYVRPNTNIRINLDKATNSITIQSPQIKEKQSNNIAEIFVNANKDLPLTSGVSIVDGQKVEQESIILIKNCLRDIDKQDLEKVSEWISEFEAGDV